MPGENRKINVDKSFSLIETVMLDTCELVMMQNEKIVIMVIITSIIIIILFILKCPLS